MNIQTFFEAVFYVLDKLTLMFLAFVLIYFALNRNRVAFANHSRHFTGCLLYNLLSFYAVYPACVLFCNG